MLLSLGYIGLFNRLIDFDETEISSKALHDSFHGEKDKFLKYWENIPYEKEYLTSL